MLISAAACRPPACGDMEDHMRESLGLESALERGRLAKRGGMFLLLLAAVGIVGINSVSCIRTGHVGVVTMFGRVTGRTMPEGIHLVNPVARVHELDIKTQEIKERASVPSKEGLIMGLEASVLYHLDPGRAADVFQKVGAN